MCWCYCRTRSICYTTCRTCTIITPSDKSPSYIRRWQCRCLCYTCYSIFIIILCLCITCWTACRCSWFKCNCSTKSSIECWCYIICWIYCCTCSIIYTTCRTCTIITPSDKSPSCIRRWQCRCLGHTCYSYSTVERLCLCISSSSSYSRLKCYRSVIFSIECWYYTM